MCKHHYLLCLHYTNVPILISLIAGTVGFYLNSVAYPDGSTVLRTDIGEGEANALRCTTDSTTCCSNLNGEMRAGDFYFPNGDMVPTSGNTSSGYYRNRFSRFILLNRRSLGETTGQFHCEIPDASGTKVNLFINIGEYVQGTFTVTCTCMSSK